MRALSLRQPWADAVVYGGKRLENRVKWTNSHFRGEFLIHASAGMTMKEWAFTSDFVAERALSWSVPPVASLRTRMGGIVGVANVVGVVRRGEDPRLVLGMMGPPNFDVQLQHRWWMGSFALILSNVRPTPFVPCKGRLGFFRVDEAIVERALGKAA
jgi:hypothetical protein